MFEGGLDIYTTFLYLALIWSRSIEREFVMF